MRNLFQEMHVRRHQTCHFRKRAISVPAEFGGKFTTCRHRSGMFKEVARSVPPDSHFLRILSDLLLLNTYVYVFGYGILRPSI